jgi:hypothetical protein
MPSELVRKELQTKQVFSSHKFKLRGVGISGSELTLMITKVGKEGVKM